MKKQLEDYLKDTNACIEAFQKLKDENKISEQSLGCLNTMLDVKDWLEPLIKQIEDTGKNKTNCCQADYSHIISHPVRNGKIHTYICKSCGRDADIPEKYHKQNCEIYEKHKKPRTDV